MAWPHMIDLLSLCLHSHVPQCYTMLHNAPKCYTTLHIATQCYTSDWLNASGKKNICKLKSQRQSWPTHQSEPIHLIMQFDKMVTCSLWEFKCVLFDPNSKSCLSAEACLFKFSELQIEERSQPAFSQLATFPDSHSWLPNSADFVFFYAICLISATPLLG